MPRPANARGAAGPGGSGTPLKRLFVRLGILPFLLLIALVAFTLMSENFLTVRNLTNVLRQSVYLTIVSLGQMLALLTGGFDLSVRTVVALSSVVGALAMATLYGAFPDMAPLAIALGFLAGIAAGLAIGAINGLGVALFDVSPFMMSLGMASVGFGIALYLTGGVPVYGMPQSFGDVFGFGELLGVATPVWVALLLIALLHVLLYRTPRGRHFYAVGGNLKAATLSGIDTRATLFVTYVLCAFFAAVAGMLLTARMDSGEANIGASMPLESIAACVIAGVSLRGGVGRLENVVLGALLILAVIADRIRLRYVASVRSWGERSIVPGPATGTASSRSRRTDAAPAPA